MTRKVVTASPETPLHEVAAFLEKNCDQARPDRGERPNWLGSSAGPNLIQAVASAAKGLEIPLSDATIRNKLMAHLKAQPWAHTGLLNITVNEALWTCGALSPRTLKTKRSAFAAETATGVRAVNDHLRTWPVDLGHKGECGSATAERSDFRRFHPESRTAAPADSMLGGAPRLDVGCNGRDDARSYDSRHVRYTDRGIESTLPTVVIYGAIVVAAFARIAAPAFPARTRGALSFSYRWMVAFGGFVASYGPMLIRARRLGSRLCC